MRRGVTKLGFLPAIALALLAGCGTGPQGDSKDGPGPLAGGAGIDWFKGDVEAAFATARAEGKPLFFYWGAEWCPPCHYLREKVFRRPEFVAASRRFVALYLDGDTERAQSLGERFGAVGYPTVIVFDPEGEEILRMTSGIPVEEYTGVLDAALDRMRPVGEVLGAVTAAGPAAAAPRDLELLAFHSWDQDDRVAPEPERRRELFRRLWEETPPELAVTRSRFLALYVDALARTAGDEAAGGAAALPDEERDVLAEAVGALLAAPRQRASNLFFLFYGAADTVELLYPEPAPRRAALVAAWLGAAAAAEEDESLSVTDRLSALRPRLALQRLAKGEEAPLPEALLAHLRQRVAWASAQELGEGELQAVLNTMAGLLADAGLLAEAETLLAERMADTRQPHYYMSWLGEIHKEAGRPREALDWFRRAWEEARGPYTRFQWGSGYLREVLELDPGDAATVETASRQVLGELLAQPDAFANRNRQRLERLESAYRDWAASEGPAAERTAVLDRLRGLVQQACPGFDASRDDSLRARCEAFLAPPAVQAAGA